MQAPRTDHARMRAIFITTIKHPEDHRGKAKSGPNVQLHDM